MRRNRRNNVGRERIVMLASSAFVLAALTMTGLYMKDKNAEVKDDGYTIDFTALENNVEDKFEEIAMNEDSGTADNAAGDTEQVAQGNMDDDLDYMPLEAGSHLVEIPGLTMDEADTDAGENTEQDTQHDSLQDAEQNSGADSVAESNEEADEEVSQETVSENMEISKELSFTEDMGLTRPVNGSVLMHYSMDGSIYFATLREYKYNPAVIFQADENTAVAACAEAKVLDIFEDSEIGRAVKLDLGNGYEAVYGQLKEIWVVEGAYVNAGDTIGTVSTPTKYYSTEGNNLYFALTKDKTAQNPEELFK